MIETLLTAWEILKPVIEIILLWFVIYHVLIFFKGTRSFQVLTGITYLGLIFFATFLFSLNTLNWIMTKLFGFSIIAFLIIFQQEIRRGLARLGSQHLFNIAMAESEIQELVNQITAAAYKMSKNKIGCLIAISRETSLNTYIESGIAIDGKVSAELLQCIFMNHSPLHDGGVIIREDRLIAASCLFPLSDNENFSKIIGTRHRAALGLTEQTDAVVLVVSEETGDISIAQEGRFIPIVNRERLMNILKNILFVQTKKHK